jgi:hypothetical protein
MVGWVGHIQLLRFHGKTPTSFCLVKCFLFYGKLPFHENRKRGNLLLKILVKWQFMYCTFSFLRMFSIIPRKKSRFWLILTPSWNSPLGLFGWSGVSNPAKSTNSIRHGRTSPLEKTDEDLVKKKSGFEIDTQLADTQAH